MTVPDTPVWVVLRPDGKRAIVLESEDDARRFPGNSWYADNWPQSRIAWLRRFDEATLAGWRVVRCRLVPDEAEKGGVAE
jgi:hypothetical protein